MELLRAHYSNVPSQLLARRLSALSLMFIANVVEFDNAPGKSRNAKFDPEPLLDMAIAALSAPAS
jgi:hypothetical protein